jgi:hypothetical protein
VQPQAGQRDIALPVHQLSECLLQGGELLVVRLQFPMNYRRGADGFLICELRQP